MADFNSGINPVDVPRAPMISAQPDFSTANALTSAGNILGVVGGSLMQGYSSAEQTAATSKSSKVIDNYQQNLLRVADLQQQGVLSPSQALRHFRMDTARALADNPTMQKEIFSTYGNIVEKAGLGQNVAKAYQQQEDNANSLHMASLTRAQSAGWGSPNDSSEQQELMAEKHQQFLFGQSQLEAANALLEHKTKEIGLINANLATQAARQSLATGGINQQKARLELAHAQAKQTFLNGAQNMSDAYFTKWQQDTNRVLADVKAGNTSKEDAIKIIQQQQAAIHQQVGSLAAGYDSTGSLDALIKPVDMLAEATLAELSGDTSRKVTENTVANITGLKSQQLLTSDPDFLTLTATSKMIPAGAGALQQALGNAAIDLLKKNNVLNSDGTIPQNTRPGDPTTHGDPKRAGEVKQYFDVVKGAISNIRAGNKDPALSTDVSGNISNILRGVGVYSKTMASPTELNTAVRFFADPQIGGYLKEHPEIIQGDNAVMAKVAIQQDYQRKVIPLIQDEFLKSHVTVGTKDIASGNPALQGRFGVLPVSDARATSGWVHTEFNGTGVTFVPNDPSKPDTVNKALELNRNVAPIVNNLIRANAHLGGSSDYKSSYEYFMQEISLPEEQDSEATRTSKEVLSGS